VTYVITEPCIGTKDQSCVAVCPVDCIHPVPGEPGFDTAEQLHIDPDECIDCDACVAACPVEAPLPESELSGDLVRFAAINAAYFAERDNRTS
jgi:ferredoxin